MLERISALKRFLSITEQPKNEAEKIESLKSAINKLQEELTQQKVITETISEENIKTKQQLEKLQPLVEFVNSFDTFENLKTILNYFKDDILENYPDGKFRPLKVEFSPYISKQIKEIAKTMGITEKEALKQLVENDLETMKKAEEKFKMLEERSKRKHRARFTVSPDPASLHTEQI